MAGGARGWLGGRSDEGGAVDGGGSPERSTTTAAEGVSLPVTYQNYWRRMYGDTLRANQAVERMHGRRGGRVTGAVWRVAEDLCADNLGKRVQPRHCGADAKLRHQRQQHGQQPMDGNAAVNIAEYLRLRSHVEQV